MFAWNCFAWYTYACFYFLIHDTVFHDVGGKLRKAWRAVRSSRLLVIIAVLRNIIGTILPEIDLIHLKTAGDRFCWCASCDASHLSSDEVADWRFAITWASIFSTYESAYTVPVLHHAPHTNLWLGLMQIESHTLQWIRRPCNEFSLQLFTNSLYYISYKWHTTEAFTE